MIETAAIVLQYVSVLAWPLTVVILVYSFRPVILRLLPGARLKLSISGVTIEKTLPELERSVSESLRGRKLSKDQWDWLASLREAGRSTYDASNYEAFRPLRNAGLIREHPEGWLSNAEEIEITPLGALLLDARGKPS